MSCMAAIVTVHTWRQKKRTKSDNKHIIVVKRERNLSPRNVQGKLHWLVMWHDNSNHKLLFCSKLVGLTLVLFGCIQSVITVSVILRYTVSYSKGETLSGDQSGPWSTAIEQQLYMVRCDNGSWEGRIQFNYTRLLCDVRCPSGEQVFTCPRKISSIFFNRLY